MDNQFTLNLLEAKTGDSFIVECGVNAFIIDGGTKSTSKHIKKYLKNTDKKLNAIFITHVDRDHIGGIVKLFTNSKSLIPLATPIYMNHPELIVMRSKDNDFVSYDDGDNLKEVLLNNGYSLYGLNRGDDIEFNDVKIETLNPTQELVTSLYKQWEKVQPAYSDSEASDLVSVEPIIIDFSIDCEEHKKTETSDIVNASSICFTLSYKDKKVLFLSDSHPDLISQQLSNDTKFDCVKISHHGSKYNTNYKLLDKIDCTKFIISTNGPRNYGHPAPSTIIKIVKSCIKRGYKSCDILFNYKKVVERIQIKNLPNGFKLNIKHSKSMEI
jgi:beta-lactamase superfamily II metal-dependent hydrolase